MVRQACFSVSNSYKQDIASSFYQLHQVSCNWWKNSTSVAIEVHSCYLTMGLRILMASSIPANEERASKLQHILVASGISIMKTFQWQLNTRTLFCGPLWGESKLAYMAHLGSLAPCFVNNDYVTAEIIYSTVHAGHEVLACSSLLCAVRICELHPRSSGNYCCIMAVSIGQPVAERI